MNLLKSYGVCDTDVVVRREIRRVAAADGRVRNGGCREGESVGEFIEFVPNCQISGTPRSL